MAASISFLVTADHWYIDILSREPVTGSYSLKYALVHLREAERFQDIRAILFRLPSTKKLSAVLRLSSSALFGIDAWKRLPAQLLGRLRETEEDQLLLSLRKESNFAKVGKWLKPLKPSLDSLEKTTIGLDGLILCIIAVRYMQLGHDSLHLERSHG